MRFIISVNIGSSLKNDQILLFIIFFDYFRIPAIVLFPVDIRANRNTYNNDSIGILFAQLIQFIIIVCLTGINHKINGVFD